MYDAWGKSVKRPLTVGMELPYKDKIRMQRENETYKYLGILEAETIKQLETKNKIQNDHYRRTRKLLGAKLSSRKPIKEINIRAVPSLDILSEVDQRWT